jgi:short-subunit dehydrogenase
VLVSGASRGLGLAIAGSLARRGTRLSLVARDTPKLAAAAKALGGMAFAADLSKPSVDVVERAEAAHGPIDVLINNAGINQVHLLRDLDEATLRAQLHTNLVTPLELTRRVLPGMLERDRGAVVNISSIAGDVAMRNQVGYCATKAGLSHATRAIQREVRGTRVQVHLVTLGLVATDMIDALKEDPIGARFAQRFSLLPVPTADEVGERVVQCIESGRRTLVLPSLAAPMHHLRLLPTYLTDGLLAGIK